MKAKRGHASHYPLLHAKTLIGLPEESLYFSFTAGRPPESIFSAWYCYGHDESSVRTIWLRFAIVTGTKSVKINRKFNHSLLCLRHSLPLLSALYLYTIFKQALVMQGLWQQQIRNTAKRAIPHLMAYLCERRGKKIMVEYKICNQLSLFSRVPQSPRVALITRYTYAYHERIL